jgi:DNA-binding XRE family transcriptional regulator
MTQAQLARKAKVALRTIHSVEKGMNCRMDTKRKILLALGLRFEDKDQVFPPAHPAAEPPGVKPRYGSRIRGDTPERRSRPSHSPSDS